MSDYESYDFESAARALKEIRDQYLAGEPLVWTGPDRLHFHVAATSSPPPWQFSAEGMAYHADQGRDFWDVYTMVAFQIGFHNGVVRMEPEVETARKNFEAMHQLLLIAQGKL